MTPFRDARVGDIPPCSRCGVRLEPAALMRDKEGRPICSVCKARVDAALQDQKAFTIYLPLVFGLSFLFVIVIFFVIGLAVYRSVPH
jgi:hypothetical protein